MKTIRKFLALFTRASRVKAEVSAIELKIAKAVALAELASKQLQQKEKEYQRAVDVLQQRQAAVKSSMDVLRKTNDSLQEAINAAREELNTAQQITIPGLVAANQLFVSRWEAETQVHVARTQAAAQALTREQ